MMYLRNIMTIYLSASVFISSEITVDGFGERNSTSGTDKELHNSSMTLTSGNATTCDHKTCLSLCCPTGKALVYGNCVEDNYTQGIFPETVEQKENDFHFVVNDPCLYGWMSSALLNDFNVLQNGSIFAPDHDEDTSYDIEHSCLFRNKDSQIYSVKVCKPWIEFVYWHTVFLILSALVLIVILISYSIVPELGNLHGLVFQAYIGTYLATHLSLVGQQFTSESKTFAPLFIFFVFNLHYLAGCCALWLNVMSFNIWRTFRGLRQIDTNTRERERKKFIWYAIYAWGTPAIINLTIIAVMAYVPFFRKFSLNKTLVLWCCATLLTSVVIVNLLLYVSTALKIRQHQKDTANLTNGVNKHHEVDTQWFNLHVKLSLITGVHTIMWVIWELWPISVTTHIMIVLELVQNILIFIIFIWKDNVKRSLRKKFDDTLDRLHNTFGSMNNSTKSTSKT